MAKKNSPLDRQLTSSQATRFFKGPLPPPETLAQYKQIQHGFAERIMTVAEHEASHRRSMDKKVAWMEFTLSMVGMLFGFIAIGGVLFLCYYAFSLGFGTQVAGIASVVLTGVGSVFLWRRNKSKEANRRLSGSCTGEQV